MTLNRLRQIWLDGRARWQAAWGAGMADDELQAAQDLGYGKQALRTILGRKRRNDLVRRREFDRLRQLRRRGGAAREPAVTTALSFDPTVLPDYPLEREETLQKIDAIEAQMARQWWRHAGARAESVAEAIGRVSPQPDRQADHEPAFRATTTAASPASVPMSALAAGSSLADATWVGETQAADTVEGDAATLPPDFLPTQMGEDTRFLDPAIWAAAELPGWGMAWQEAALQWAKAGNVAVTRGLLRVVTAQDEALSGMVSHGRQALQDLACVEQAAQDIGVLSGDITPLCEAQAQWQGARLVLTCDGWLRLDFAAAGSLINWVQARQGPAVQVELREVHPLVAALLELLGLDTQARIVPVA